MPGYDPKFLSAANPDLEVPLPSFSPAVASHILRGPQLSGGVWRDFLHFSIATNRTMRAPAVAALNIDQQHLVEGLGGSGWGVDSEIGEASQLGEAYYARAGDMDNPWDRGHLAMRANAAWGTDGDVAEAQAASDATFTFANAALQHRNFNRDEWQALETWVRDLQATSNRRITSFSGPVWFHFPRSVTPPRHATALVPSAFFKVVCFVGEGETLQARAFLMTQDASALRDSNSRHLYDFENYQVTVADIENLTGLRFPAKVAAANPLLARATLETRQRLRISHVPERIEIGSPEEMIGPDHLRDRFLDDLVDVFISAALVNPAGADRDEEWVSILNLQAVPQDLSGWSIDGGTRDETFFLSGTLEPGEAKAFKRLSPLRLNNSGGAIRLFDADGNRIDRVRYSANQGRRQGRPVVFAYRDIE